MNINVFSMGESTDVNTWSNLPFYLCAALERRATLRRIDLLSSLDSRAARAFRAFSPLRRLFAASQVDSFRTRPDCYLIQKRLARLSRTSEADLNLFLTFSFSSYKTSRTPVVHYCDRTYEHFLEENGLTATRNDRYYIEQEKQNLRNALCVVATHELCREFIRERYGIEHVVLVRAGINIGANFVPEPDSLIKEKSHSREVIFVARGAYRRGADIAIDAFRLAAQHKPKGWQLHIVGVGPDEISVRDERVHVYGYLRKDVPAELAVYSDLLRRARLFVCPVRAGQPPTGIIREAQMMCTPVLISDVSDGRELVTHGYNGLITDDLRPETFAHHISQLLENDELWSKLAKGAHESIKERTWDKTASEMLEAVSDARRGVFKRHTAPSAESAAASYRRP